MKKILLLIAATVLLMGVIASCDSSDEPERGNGVFIVNTPMINHVVNLNTGEVVGIASTSNKLTIDTVNHKASLELNYNDGNGNQTLKLNDITATAKRLGFYTLSMSSDPTFSGYVDFNEGSMRYRYQTANGLRIISTLREVFFLKTHNVISYLDTTEATTMESTMYQFNIDPASQKAIVKVMDIVHAKANDMKRFIDITATNVPFTVTTNGYSIAAENVRTNANYIAFTDSTTGTNDRIKSTNQYPFKVFNATIDLVNDHLEANYMIGDSAIVNATGRTYPDYSSY